MKNRNRTGYLLLFTAVFALSCKVSKDYQRPALNDLPKQFRGTTYSDTSSIANIEWKTFFTDTSLQSLIAKGIAYNNDLQLAIKRIDVAQLQAKQAKLLWLPQIDAQITGQYDRMSGNSFNGLSTQSFLNTNHIEDYVVGLDLSWEADIWGKISRQKEAALDVYLQSYEAKKAVQTEVVADIASGFYNLLMLDKQLAIAKNNLLLSDSTLRLTKLLKDAGEATLLSIEQTEAQRQSVALLVPQLEQSITIQENALQLLTGQYPDTIALHAQLADFSVPENLPVGLPAAIVSNRPDVRSAEIDVMIANAKVGIAQSYMYPSLTIDASAGLESFKASNWFNIPGSLFGIVTGGIAQPIFDHKQLKTNYQVAKLQRDQSVIQFRQSVLNAVTDVSNALVSVNKLKEEEEIADSETTTLHQAISNSLLLYKSDMANYLDVITAQSNALQAELNLASIRSRELMAVVELYRSVGGGWK